MLRAFASFLAISLTLALFFVPKLAAAQSSDADEAKRKGDEAMVALRYEEALAAYKKAYEITKSPALLYNMGRAYEGLADFPKAADALAEFSDKASPELKSRVPKLDELLKDVNNRVATLVITSPVDGAEIRLGERVVGKTRSGLVLRVNAGKQRLVVSAEGYFPFEKELALAGNKVETVDAPLMAKATSAILRVTSPVTGASVALDGKAVGVVPTESFIAAGAHKVLLQREGYQNAETNVVVNAGEKKNVDIPMAQNASILGKWWFWTAVGAVVVAGTVTAIALTTERDPDSGTIPPGQVKAELKLGF